MGIRPEELIWILLNSKVTLRISVNIHFHDHVRNHMPQSSISHSMFCRSLVLKDFPGKQFQICLGNCFLQSLLKAHNAYQHKPRLRSIAKYWDYLFKKSLYCKLNMSHRPGKAVSVVTCINIPGNSCFIDYTGGK